jgi:3-methyladenine DNA glycosylase AlkC
MKHLPQLPPAPPTISKGLTLRVLLDRPAIEQLARNLSIADRIFKSKPFIADALKGLDQLEILDRGRHIAKALRAHLPQSYEDAIEILLRSLTPPLARTSDNGLGVFFYLPHTNFVSAHGLDPQYFETSMRAQYELTRRFSAEFSMRQFLIQHQDRTLARLLEWTGDRCPHVRRLCSEGSRPRLPWAERIPAFIRDPRPTLPILEALKDDPNLYVRRSVANHLGDIAKDHPDLAFEICRAWSKRGASPERKWLIRHALRHPAKKGDAAALALRKSCAP